MFLADENIPVKIIEYLESAGYSVMDLRKYKIKHLTDEQVMSFATDKKLILLTFDKHFSNIMKYPPEKYYGIIRIRIHPPILDDIKKSLQLFFDKMKVDDIAGKLIVLEKDGFRIRK